MLLVYMAALVFLGLQMPQAFMERWKHNRMSNHLIT